MLESTDNQPLELTVLYLLLCFPLEQMCSGRFRSHKVDKGYTGEQGGRGIWGDFLPLKGEACIN